MIAIYTISGKNNRYFEYNQQQQAFEYYNKIKDIERSELHYLFYAIFPENIYSLQKDKNRADKLRSEFLNKLQKKGVKNGKKC